MKKVFCFVVMSLFFMCSFIAAQADVIYLQKGDEIECIIKENANESMTVLTKEGEVAYPKSEIKAFVKYSDEQNEELKERWRPKEKATKEKSKKRGRTAKETVQTYLKAIKGWPKEKLAPLWSKSTIKKWGVFQPTKTQRKNMMTYYSNNPYMIKYVSSNEAVIWFKEQRNHTAAPWILTKEGGDWKVDVFKQYYAIIYDYENRWYWVSKRAARHFGDFSGKRIWKGELPKDFKYY